MNRPSSVLVLALTFLAAHQTCAFASPASEVRKGASAVRHQTNKVDQKINDAQRSVDHATAQVDSADATTDEAGAVIDETKRSLNHTKDSAKRLKDSIFGSVPFHSSGNSQARAAGEAFSSLASGNASTDTVIVSRGGPLHLDTLVERWLDRHGATASDMASREGESQIFGPALPRKAGESAKAYQARWQKAQAALGAELEDPAELDRRIVVTRVPFKLGNYDAGTHRVRVMVTTVGEGFEYPGYISLDDARYAQWRDGGGCMEFAPRPGMLEGFACIPEKQAGEWQKLAQLPAGDDRHIYAEVGLSVAASSIASPAQYKERAVEGMSAGLLYARPTVHVLSCAIKSGSQVLAQMRPVAIEAGFEPSADADDGAPSRGLSK